MTTTTRNAHSPPTAPRDFMAGLVVFLVALPLCLGMALASNAPLFSGVVAGVIGGVLVGLLSGSHSSVSGPGNTMMAIVAAQILALGSFRAFLLAVLIAGLIQIALGVVRAGFIAAFVPSSVIKGLLAAVGIILTLKQIPHVLGHDPDPEGDMSFFQTDKANTFTEIVRTLWDIQPGAAAVGLSSLLLLVLWDVWKPLKRSGLPAALAVVLMGVGMSLLFKWIGGGWAISSSHLVQVPVPEDFKGFLALLQSPDFSQWSNPGVYTAALTIAAVASLETLLNLEAADKIDPQQRTSPPSRELVAQGVGNVVAGLIGGIPISSAIVRSSVNLNAGAATKLSTIVHGTLLLVSVMFLPAYLNMIPLACLAAILLVTGLKLVSPALIRQMWDVGRQQFIPFALTVVSIVLTDLLTGILIGLGASIAFILDSNVRRPLRRVVEKHLGGDVVHIELANQVSFLNRAVLDKTLDEIPRGGQVLLDARTTDYIDPDVLALIRDFKDKKAPARGIEVSLLGFRRRYLLEDQTQYVDYSTREIQSAVTPAQVLEILREGHDRFRSGHRLTRDFNRVVTATARGQHPLAVVLGCIDSRTPAELIFDLGMGDIFTVRVAGNISSRKVLGSVEYGTGVAGAKLVLVLGHTRCGAVTAAVDLMNSTRSPAEVTGCQHIGQIVGDIQKAIDPDDTRDIARLSPQEKVEYTNDVARRNVARVVEELPNQSETLRALVNEGKIAIVGAMYDVASGDMEFLPGSVGAPCEVAASV
ncbi:SulP family inorganic anion transporter [Isosphaeraceae bacterium EP7]